MALKRRASGQPAWFWTFFAHGLKLKHGWTERPTSAGRAAGDEGCRRGRHDAGRDGSRPLRRAGRSRPAGEPAGGAPGSHPRSGTRLRGVPDLRLGVKAHRGNCERTPVTLSETLLWALPSNPSAALQFPRSFFAPFRSLRMTEQKIWGNPNGTPSNLSTRRLDLQRSTKGREHRAQSGWPESRAYPEDLHSPIRNIANTEASCYFEPTFSNFDRVNGSRHTGTVAGSIGPMRLTARVRDHAFVRRRITHFVYLG